MSKWYVLGDGWTPEIKTRCASICADELGEPACWELADSGQVGGEIERMEPCELCAAPENNQLLGTMGETK